MSRLYLLRHAKAAWGAPGTPDFDRPLTPEGMRAARAAGAALAAAGQMPALAACSPALRTRQTFEGVAQAFAASLPVRMDASLYDSDTQSYLAALNAAGDAPSLLMVGHNPMTEEFGAALAGSGEPQAMAALKGGFPVCGLAVIVFDLPFAAAKPGLGRIESFSVHEG